MFIYDLSHALNENVSIYPNDPAFKATNVASVKEHGYTVTSLSMGSHTGTHIDAPYHFFEDGRKIDELNLSSLIDVAAIVDVRGKTNREVITWDDLTSFHSLIKECRILILQTGWSQYWGTSKYYDHPYLSREVANNIISSGVQILGIDTLNPDQTILDGSDGDFGVHEVLLGAGCLIVENLTNLYALPEPKMTVSLLPLSLSACDASPIRAVAWQTNL